MIHRLLVVDRDKSVGVTLYDDDIIQFQADLLIGLSQALLLLGEELGKAKGDLKEAELGTYQIGIITRDHLAYVAVQDAYDSEPFTKRILDSVIKEFHPYFIKTNFNVKIKKFEQVKQRIAELLQTMKFPTHLIPLINPHIDQFMIRTNHIADCLFIADLDDGIVNIYEEPENENIIKLLMEILSEIPFERRWLGETKLMNSREIHGRTITHHLNRIYTIF